MSKISVIIPCYNAQLYIGECLDSVINQTYQNIEIICIDDGSSDDTLLILEQFKNIYPAFITVIAVPNKGAPAARNLGLERATGEYVQFLDADDILKLTKFEFQIKGFDSAEINMVVSDRVTMDEKFKSVIETHTFAEIEAIPLNTAISKIIITGNPLYKKNFIVKIGGWKEQLPNAQDWELNIRAVLQGAKIRYIRGEYLISRVVANSLSSNWIKVSLTCSSIIQEYYGNILSNEEKLNTNSYKKLFFIFYIAAIHFKESSDRNCSFIIEKVPNWKANLSFVKRVYASVFGLNRLVQLERLF